MNIFHIFELIIIKTKSDFIGIQAWLEAYHRTSCGYGPKQALDHGDLEARVGSIQAAINLEIAHEKFTHLNVKVEGLNGQLPNLDLFNLINRLSMKEGLPPMFQGNEDHSSSYWRSLKTFITMAMKQAAGGVPSGNHGLFHRFGIESVTIESVHKFTKKTRRREFSFFTAGRILEGVFRSLNNLLERFHQSFFFYLLASTKEYVSIGMYMPGFGCLAGSLLVKALGLWYQCLSEVNPDKKREILSKSPNVVSVFPGWLLVHLTGILLAIVLPRSASVVGEKFDLNTDDSVSLAILAFCIFAIIMISRDSNSFGKSWRLVKCFALLEISVLAFAMSLVNFSLAYIVTLFLAPVAMFASPKKIKILLVLLVHPLSLIFGFCLIDTFRSFPEKSFLDLIWSGLSASKQAIMFSITDGYIYGNYTFITGAVFLLPCWLLIWHVCISNVKEDKLKTE